DCRWIRGGSDQIHYPTRMAVIRLSGGGLFLWSPIPLTDGLRAEVDALGEVSHIVAPNSLHHFVPCVFLLIGKCYRPRNPLRSRAVTGSRQLQKVKMAGLRFESKAVARTLQLTFP